jgi:hypothetical protein
MPANVDADGAVVRATAALDAALGIGNNLCIGKDVQGGEETAHGVTRGGVCASSKRL